VDTHRAGGDLPGTLLEVASCCGGVTGFRAGKETDRAVGAAHGGLRPGCDNDFTRLLCFVGTNAARRPRCQLLLCCRGNPRATPRPTLSFVSGPAPGCTQAPFGMDCSRFGGSILGGCGCHERPRTAQHA
jgi:hypothetical protein